MSNKVEIVNSQRGHSLTKTQKELVYKTVDAVLKYENIKYDCEIAIELINDKKIHLLNKEFRNIDRPTDVLSFPSGEYPPQENDSEMCFLGDMAISVQRAIVQAEEYGHSFERELCFLVAHSTLHLLGYDHMTEIEEKDMFARQEAILTSVGITR